MIMGRDILSATLTENQLIQSWKNFFEENYKEELETIAATYPATRSINVDYWDVDRFDHNLAEHLTNKPLNAIFHAEEAIKTIDTAAEETLKLHLRIKNLKDLHKIRIRDKNSLQIGKLRTISGIIRKRTPPRPKLKLGGFVCDKCGAVIQVEQDAEIFKEPAECYTDQGGCGRVSSFNLSKSLSTYLNFMKIEVQEGTEDLAGSQQPETITVFIEDDLVSADRLNPGDRITVTGIFDTIQRRRGSNLLTSFDMVMNANHYTIEESTFQSIDIDDEDIEQIKEIAGDPQIYEQLRDSIAPSIYEMNEAKQAISFQLLGSDSRKLSDGTFRRGDIHILLIGDPGIAKSVLLKYTSHVAPKSVMASGTSATGAGLTAAAVRDDFGDGQWTLEAGALVLADMGTACIDELDKMQETDRNKLHTAMEQQEIPINKAGINTILPTRTSVLASANPHLGSFDDVTEIYEQVDLPATIISRFDLVFILRDRIDREKDAATAKHILKVDTDEGSVEPIFSPEFIRKFVAYAKEHCHPTLTSSSIDIMTEFYVSLRTKRTNDGPPITPRQLESLKRLAKASARMQLQDEVRPDDCRRAIEIYTSAIEGYGGFDSLRKLMTGFSSEDHALFASLKNSNMLPCPVQHVLNEGYKDDDIERLKSLNLIEESRGKLFIKKEGY